MRCGGLKLSPAQESQRGEVGMDTARGSHRAPTMDSLRGTEAKKKKKMEKRKARPDCHNKAIHAQTDKGKHPRLGPSQGQSPHLGTALRAGPTARRHPAPSARRAAPGRPREAPCVRGPGPAASLPACRRPPPPPPSAAACCGRPRRRPRRAWVAPAPAPASRRGRPRRRRSGAAAVAAAAAAAGAGRPPPSAPPEPRPPPAAVAPLCHRDRPAPPEEKRRTRRSGRRSCVRAQRAPTHRSASVTGSAAAGEGPKPLGNLRRCRSRATPARQPSATAEGGARGVEGRGGAGPRRGTGRPAPGGKWPPGSGLGVPAAFRRAAGRLRCGREAGV